MGQRKGEVSLMSDGSEWTVMIVGRPETQLSRVVHGRSSRQALSLLREHVQLNQINKETPLLIVVVGGQSHHYLVCDLLDGHLKLDSFLSKSR